jgi:hypothetical protein
MLRRVTPRGASLPQTRSRSRFNVRFETTEFPVDPVDSPTPLCRLRTTISKRSTDVCPREFEVVRLPRDAGRSCGAGEEKLARAQRMKRVKCAGRQAGFSRSRSHRGFAPTLPSHRCPAGGRRPVKITAEKRWALPGGKGGPVGMRKGVNEGRSLHHDAEHQERRSRSTRPRVG